jgi:hypothetical protein
MKPSEQRSPVWTNISLSTTVAVEILVLIAANSMSHASFGAIGIALSTGLVIVVGILISTIAGYRAHERGERWGGRIAALGILVWIATVYQHYH